jgi:hypothetical protein
MKVRYFEPIVVIAALVCLSLLCAVGAKAQSTASITGMVTDTSGAVIPGANVTLTNTATNVSQTQETSSGGDYVFPLLDVGTYAVKVEAKGFKTFSAPAIPVSAGDRARVDAAMQVGEQSTTVEVQASTAPALQTDTSTIATLITSQAVEDLPLNGRNIVKLVQLSAGVTEGSPGSAVQGSRPDDRRQTSAFSVNGNVDEMNNEQVDGFDNNERIIGSVVVRPAIDAIQEVNVSTNKYDVTQGHTPGGVVDIITKSGTNGYHGSAYEFFRNKVLNTNPNYNFPLALNPIGSATCPTAAACASAGNPAFRQNQWGGSLGGPIRKDKTFFFADYEGLSYAQGLAVTTTTVPTLCEKGLAVCPDGKTQYGDFSDNASVSAPGGGSTQCSTPTAVTAGPAYGSAACPYVTVPAGSITPLGRAYFNMYPLPNTGSGSTLLNNFVASPVKFQSSDTYDVRLDQHFSDRDTMYGRWTHNGETTQNPNAYPTVHIDPATGNLSSSGVAVTPVVTQYAGPNSEVQNAIALSYVHVFNPNLLLNLKAGAFHSAIESFPANQNSNVSNKLGFPCNAVSCVNFESGASSLLQVAVATLNGSPSYNTVGDTSFLPLLEFDTGFQYTAGMTWNKGAHSIRFGLGLIRRRATIIDSSAPNGTMTYNGSFTGVGGADLLEGLPIRQARSNFLPQQSFRSWEPSGYVQDDWRFKSWLTLNLGMRYDIFTPYTEVHGRISNYDPFNGLIVSPSLPGNQQSSSTANVPTLYNDWSPRIGFAATLKHSMVLRGGYGLVFYPVNYHSPYFLGNAPFVFSENCNVQTETNSNVSCVGTPYASTATATYGVCPFTGSGCTTGTTLNSASTVYRGGSCASTATAGCGGALMTAGIPTPSLNVALATNTANYAGTSIAAIPPNAAESYMQQTNLQLQKQFGANVIAVGYVGEFGRHIAAFNGSANENVAANPTETAPNGATLPAVLGGATTGFGTLAGFPWLNKTTINETVSNGVSSYNALQAAFVRRFSHGLTVNFNYTWAHSMDNVSSRGCVMSTLTSPQPCWFDLAKGAGPNISSFSLPANTCASEPTQCRPLFGYQQSAWGNGANDNADNFHWAVNYQLPFGKSMTGVEGMIVKGWGANVSGSWQTGQDFSVTNATLDQIGDGRVPNPTIRQWFNYNDFVQATPGTMALQKPNQFFGPPQRRLDFSIFKEFPVKEQIRLQFRTEVFNLFNSPNFGQPNTTVTFTGTGPTGIKNTVPPVQIDASHITGEINSMNGNWNQREIQFALRLIF